MRIILLLISVLFLANSAVAAEFIVKLKDHGLTQAQSGLFARADFESLLLERHEPGQWVVMELNDQDRKNLMADPNVEYIVPNMLFHISQQSSVEQIDPDQWGLVRVQIEKAWALAGNHGSKAVKVGIIDTGVDETHHNLAGNVAPGLCFLENQTSTNEGVGGSGHGTHCAGILGAHPGGGPRPVSGVSPEVTIIPFRAIDLKGAGKMSDLIKAIDAAVAAKVDIISASWGQRSYPFDAAPMIEAVRRADRAGIIFVAAAGNENVNLDYGPVFPAATNGKNMIVVAASNPDDTFAGFSNYGDRAHIEAPGVAILSTMPGDQYKALSGTSMATPFVAGLTAFLKAQDPSLTGEQVRAILQRTGDGMNAKISCHCQINALAATEAVLKKSPLIVPATWALGPHESKQVYVFHGVGPYHFESSNPAVLSVTAEGLATGVKFGTAKIKATSVDGQQLTTLDFQVEEQAVLEPGICPYHSKFLCTSVCMTIPSTKWCH